jgi:hypothetical protein
MRLTYLGKTGNSQGGNCPSMYRTDRGTYVVQGKRLNGDDRAQLRDVGVDEDAVEVPADVFRFVTGGEV